MKSTFCNLFYHIKDALLFEGIYKDLFSGIEIPNPDRDELKKHIMTHLEERNLQSTPWYMGKIIQVILITSLL
jgi:dynein heavy chain, axonemal